MSIPTNHPYLPRAITKPTGPANYFRFTHKLIFFKKRDFISVLLAISQNGIFFSIENREKTP